MTRLTFKVNDAYYVEEMRHLYGDTWELVQALGKYEDLEEELGIDFITFFKAMKNGIYCIVEDENNNKVIEKFRATQLCYNPETKLFYWYGSIIGYPDLIDYGKTWALTKEELQDDK